MVAMTKNPSSFRSCFLLVAISQLIVAILSDELPFPPPPQFCDDGNPPGIKDISLVVINRDSKSVLQEVIHTFFGDMVTSSILLGTHQGTHVVSPGHFLGVSRNYTADKLNFRTLVGPVLVVAVPEEVQRITAKVLQSLNLPVGLKRVIFLTNNTYSNLIKKPFSPDYTGLTPDAATWLAQNTTIEFVGMDYISVAVYDQLSEVYENLFAKPTIVPVEGLCLEDVKPGEYTVYCLPLRLEAESSPARCILVE